MPQYDLHMFLAEAYIDRRLELTGNVILTPLDGFGATSFAECADRFIQRFLGQGPISEEIMDAQKERGREDGASVVVSFHKINADSEEDVIRGAEAKFTAIRDAIVVRQKTRGRLAGFLLVQTDVNPVRITIWPYTQNVRKIILLPPSDGASGLDSLVSEALAGNGLVRQYLSLYSDAVGSQDMWHSPGSIETKLLKLWTLLEAMALCFKGSKKEMVGKLYHHHHLTITEDYQGLIGDSILDVAYALRNVVAHAGGCAAATQPKDVQACAKYGHLLEVVANDLEQDAGRLIESYAAHLQRDRLGLPKTSDPVNFHDMLRVQFDGTGNPPIVSVVPGTSSIALGITPPAFEDMHGIEIIVESSESPASDLAAIDHSSTPEF